MKNIEQKYVQQDNSIYLLVGRLKPVMMMLPWKWASPGYLFSANGSRKGSVYVFKGSHHSKFYSNKDRRLMVNVFEMNPIRLLQFSAVICNGFLQPAGLDDLGYFKRRHHLYLFPNNASPQNAIMLRFYLSFGMMVLEQEVGQMKLLGEKIEDLLMLKVVVPIE